MIRTAPNRIVAAITLACGMSVMAFAAIAPSSPKGYDAAGKPNIIVVFNDDMGYADVGCFGSEKNPTPRIDQMAAEGRKFTDFYVTSSVCTPSRASLMTGYYPKRIELEMEKRA